MEVWHESGQAELQGKKRKRRKKQLKRKQKKRHLSGKSVPIASRIVSRYSKISSKSYQNYTRKKFRYQPAKKSISPIIDAAYFSSPKSRFNAYVSHYKTKSQLRNFKTKDLKENKKYRHWKKQKFNKKSEMSKRHFRKTETINNIGNECQKKVEVGTHQK